MPKRALPWVLFSLGLVSIGFGAVTGELTGLAIGVIALGGAVTSWAAEWLLGGLSSRREDDGEDR